MVEDKIFDFLENGLIDNLFNEININPSSVNLLLKNELTVFETLLDFGYSNAARRLLDFEELDYNHRSHNPLEMAIKTGSIDLAFVLLEKGASPNYRPEGKVSSALLLCLENEYFDLAQAMVKHGAEVDIRNKLGWTPLIWASIKGLGKAVDFLLENGANIHACNNDGWNAVTGAYFKKRINIVNCLLEKGAVFSEKYKGAVLLSSYDSGNKEIGNYLINEDKLNPNVSNDKGISLLALAVEKGDWEMVRLLVDKKADLNVFDSKGKPLVATLARDGKVDLIDLFLKNGADIHLASKGGVNAIWQAAYYDQQETVSYLLSKGANINTQNSLGWTPLMLAASNGSLELVNILLENNANQLLVNEENYTAKKIARLNAPKDNRLKMLPSTYSDIFNLLK